MGNPTDGSIAGPSTIPDPETTTPNNNPSPSQPQFLATVSRAVSRMTARRSNSQSSNTDTETRNEESSPGSRVQQANTEVPVSADPELRGSLSEEELRRTFRGTWPIRGSSFFACLSCVLGLFNISRFCTMVFVYKGPFIVEFILLSVVLGIPFLFLMVALGQYLGSGMLDMWYISPAFKGVGVALLYLYIIIGVYTAIPISWLFVYFKDSFITARETYKWSLCNPKYATEVCVSSLNSSLPDYIGWTVPSYFHGQVLDHRSSESNMGDMKFEVAFNLAIVWLLVFVSLSRGIRTYGKTVFALGLMPITLLLMVAIRFYEQWGRGIVLIFAVPWKPVLTDPWTWLLAAREVFLTWVVFGGVVLQHSSHNKPDVRIARLVLSLAFVTLLALFLAAMFVASAVHALYVRGLSILPTSFEFENVTKLLTSTSEQKSVILTVTPVNLLVGDCLVPTRSNPSHTSGYQVLRLATEIFPAVLAVEGARSVSSFWAICFYGMLIMLGLGQQVAIWSCVVESIIAFNYKILLQWQTIVTFVLCTVGLLLGLPLTTNLGLPIVFFFDFCVGALWWLAAVYLIMLIAVLLIRDCRNFSRPLPIPIYLDYCVLYFPLCSITSIADVLTHRAATMKLLFPSRPYGTDQLVGIVTKRRTVRMWLLPVLTFQWNVVLPVSFLVLSIAFLRTGQQGPAYSWPDLADQYRFWPRWVKRLASAVQITPLLGMLLVCGVQAYRHLSPRSDVPLHQRVQSWCCPIFPPAAIGSREVNANNTRQSPTGVVNAAFEDDPPPKYTPPPSYSTATARVIARQLLHHGSGGIELQTVECERAPPPPASYTLADTISDVVSVAPSSGPTGLHQYLTARLEGLTALPEESGEVNQEMNPETETEENDCNPLRNEEHIPQTNEIEEMTSENGEQSSMEKYANVSLQCAVESSLTDEADTDCYIPMDAVQSVVDKMVKNDSAAETPVYQPNTSRKEQVELEHQSISSLGVEKTDRTDASHVVKFLESVIEQTEPLSSEEGHIACNDRTEVCQNNSGHNAE